MTNYLHRLMFVLVHTQLEELQTLEIKLEHAWKQYRGGQLLTLVDISACLLSFWSTLSSLHAFISSTDDFPDFHLHMWSHTQSRILCCQAKSFSSVNTSNPSIALCKKILRLCFLLYKPIIINNKLFHLKLLLDYCVVWNWLCWRNSCTAWNGWCWRG